MGTSKTKLGVRVKGSLASQASMGAAQSATTRKAAKRTPTDRTQTHVMRVIRVTESAAGAIINGTRSELPSPPVATACLVEMVRMGTGNGSKRDGLSRIT